MHGELAFAYPYPSSRLVFELRRWFGTLPWISDAFADPIELTGQDYVYYASHYEPEMSVAAASPTITDQLAVVESLSKSLPAGWTVAVKEHIPMLGRRPRGYYNRLKAMPNVKLISPYADGFLLLKSCRAVVTLTGTVGTEAILLGRPVVFLGLSPIQLVGEGFTRCHHITALGTALEQAMEIPPARDATLERFLGCMFDASIDLSADDWWGGINSVTRQQVTNRKALCDQMAQLILDALASPLNAVS